MNDTVASDGKPDMTLEEQQIASADSIALDLYTDSDLVFSISRNIDAKSTQHGSNQATAIKSGGSDTAPQIRDTEETPGFVHDLCSTWSSSDGRFQTARTQP
jgi:hypothetical protein